MTPPGLIQVVHRFEDIFERMGVRRSYGGAIACNHWGPPRLTLDVDVLALVADTRVPALVDELAAAGCLHGDRNPRPLDLVAVLADLRSKARMATFLLGGTRVEVFLPWPPFHHRVLARSPERELDGRGIRTLLAYAAEARISRSSTGRNRLDLAWLRTLVLGTRAHA